MKYHKSNFKSIGKLIAPLVKRHGQVNKINCATLMNVWGEVVGEDTSKKAYPIKIKSIKGGEKNILHLGMTGPYMAQLSLQTQDIIEKINSHYSREVIVQIKLQRIVDNSDKNVVELDKPHDFGAKKNEEVNDPKRLVMKLEEALTILKNNLSNSRKKK